MIPSSLVEQNDGSPCRFCEENYFYGLIESLSVVKVVVNPPKNGVALDIPKGIQEDIC